MRAPSLLLALVLVFPGAPSASPGRTVSPQQDSEPARTHILSVAREIMLAARYGMLITLGDNHEPQARIVDPLSPDGSFVVYVATNPLSRKVAEIRRDSRVTLAYFDPDRLGYVTLIARAEEVGEVEKRSQHKDAWQPFFDRERPETYILYRIAPSRLEVVSAKDGINGDEVTWLPEIVELK